MKILRLTSSFRGKDSMSLQLGNAIVAKFKNQDSNTVVTRRDLAKNEVPHLNGLHLTAFFTPIENHTPELRSAISYSDQAINELLANEVIVIDVPMYNFGIPSSLKAWIDHIVRAGVTFQYSENGAEGLIKGKKVFLAIASGGLYSEGPMAGFDFTENYLKKLLSFIGITDIITFRVEGTAVPEIKETALLKAIEAVDSYNFDSFKTQS